MQVQKIIEHLGYTPKEVKVYLAALGLGDSSVTEIAAKAKLPRTSVQVIADKLHREGLMASYTQGRYKRWVAENPEQLLKQLQAREDEVRAALPRLSALQKTGRKGRKPAVKVFEGSIELGLVFDDIIATKHHVLAIIPHDSFLSALGSMAAWNDFQEKLGRHFLRMRMLVPDSVAGHALVSAEQDALSQARILPERIGIRTAVFVFGDKTALVLPSQRQPTAVLLEDAGTRDTMAALFEQLWEKAGGGQDDAESGLFHAIADASPQALLIANAKREIAYVNSAWERQFGYSLAEVRGKDPRILQSGETPREVYVRMRDALVAGETFQSDEIVDKRKDGTLFNLLTTIFPVRTGATLHYVQILDDITERKRVEDTRQKFIRTAATDLRPSLAKLDLVRGLLGEEGKDGMSGILRDEIAKIERLAEKLLG